MSIVLDASVTLAWFFNDEQSTFSENLLDQVAEKGAFAPSIWPLEICNGLLMGYRRKRISQADFHASLETLNALAIIVDASSLSHVLMKIPALAQEHQLTAYDAAYLELALRMGVPLATADAQIIKAANKLKHPLFDKDGSHGS